MKRDELLVADARLNVVAGPFSFTYKVGRGEANPPRYPNPAWFFSVTAEGKRPAYVGMVDPETGELRSTRNSRVDEDDMRFKVLAAVLRSVWKDEGKTLVSSGWLVTVDAPKPASAEDVFALVANAAMPEDQCQKLMDLLNNGKK